MTQLFLFEERQPAIPDADEVEVWVECPGFPRYEVSNFGDFRVLMTGKRMSRQKDINGYPIVLLTRDGRQQAKLAHRLVCEAFHGPGPEDRPFVNHLNRVKHDNRAANLEWTSRSLNAKHWRRQAAG